MYDHMVVPLFLLLKILDNIYNFYYVKIYWIRWELKIIAV